MRFKIAISPRRGSRFLLVYSSEKKTGEKLGISLWILLEKNSPMQKTLLRKLKENSREGHTIEDLLYSRKNGTKNRPYLTLEGVKKDCAI